MLNNKIEFNIENSYDLEEYQSKIQQVLQIDKIRVEPKTIFSNERTFLK